MEDLNCYIRLLKSVPVNYSHFKLTYGVQVDKTSLSHDPKCFDPINP